jgi:hypothetical protein
MMNVSGISAGFLQNIGAWIFLPAEVKYFIADEGGNYAALPVTTHKTEIADRKNILIKEFKSEFKTTKTRFIKIIAINVGACPDWHPGAGGKAWLFVDEIAVH